MLKDARSYNPLTSMRARFLYLMAFLTAFILAAVLFVALNSLRQENLRAQQQSSLALSSQAEDNLQKLTASVASNFDQSLVQILGEARKISSLVASIYMGRVSITGDSTWSLKEHVIQGQQGQFVNPSTTDPTRMFLPNTHSLGKLEEADLRQTAALDWLLPEIIKNNPSIQAAYFGTVNEIFRYVTNQEPRQDLPPNFQVTLQPWFTVSLQGGKDREYYWTSPYEGAFGKVVVVTVAVPAYDMAGKLIGVAGIDIAQSEILAGIQKANFTQSSYTFLLDATGKTIVFPDQMYQDFLVREPVGEKFGTDLSTSEKAKQFLPRMLNGETGLQRINTEGGDLYVSFAPLPSSGWSLATVVNANVVQEAASGMQSTLNQDLRVFLYQRILPVTLAAFLITLVIAFLVIDRWFRPIQTLVQAAEQYGKGQWDIEIPITRRDEVGMLAGSIKVMKDSLQHAVRALEDRVTERTRDRDRHAAQVQIGADIVHEISGSRHLEDVLSLTVNRMVDRFNYYFTGVYLLDSRGEYAVLQASSGEGGAGLREQGYRVRLGSSSVIGYVVNSGEAKVIPDTSLDSLYEQNLYLPETRSEIALPLRLGQEVIGILDVHSQDVGAFSPYELNLLHMIADQLAIVIENARLFKDYQENLQELENLYGRINQQTWKRLIQTREVIGYEYDAGGIKPLYRSDLARARSVPEEIISADQEETSYAPIPIQGAKTPFSLPIKVRGEVVALLDVWPAGDGLTPAELRLLSLVNERLNQAIESARVFEETQNLAFREQTINQFVTNLTNTLDLNTLLQNAVRQLGNLPDVTEISIRLGPGNNHS